jgi:hypothetical protein
MSKTPVVVSPKSNVYVPILSKPEIVVVGSVSLANETTDGLLLAGNHAALPEPAIVAIA